MGTINGRLQRIYAATIPTYAPPVIITLAAQPTPQVLATIQKAGAGPIRSTTKTPSTVATTATAAAAQAIAALANVVEVFHDEPLVAFR